MRIQLCLFAALAFLVVELHAAASDESFPACTVSVLCEDGEFITDCLRDYMRQAIILRLLVEREQNMLLRQYCTFQQTFGLCYK